MEFDPNGFALHNDNFIGLPADESSAELILLPVPWDLTTSFRPGTSNAPLDILNLSYQLDLFDPDFRDQWKKGIYFCPIDPRIQGLNDKNRPLAKQHIDFLESGGQITAFSPQQSRLEQINESSILLNQWVYQKTKTYLEAGKKIGLVGGDHSTPLGYYQALAEIHGPFSILQIDAHCDLRPAYEGFKHSHASIMFNALDESYVDKIHQVGIRDCSHEEFEFAQKHPKVVLHTMHNIRASLFQGNSFKQIVDQVLDGINGSIYISFDIDGLDPTNCPATGTPVPGGLSYEQADYLLRELSKKDLRLIGFDFVETGANSITDANTAARLIYLMSLITLSQ